MSQPAYPFSALVGLEELRLALALAAVDPRLSVLAFGEKGSGKSTAARALAQLLPPPAPFVEVPIGVTEDRLLGGLDLEAAFSGQARLKPGLVQSACGGVLYLDEVNLLPDALADALLDVLASGVYRLERDGFSLVAQSEFILLGTMNPEEGTLRPQLRDRFALAVQVRPPTDPAERSAIVRSREEFDADPKAFCARFEEAEEALRHRVAAARQLRANVAVPPAVGIRIAELVTRHGVASLRADLALHRACRALAAWEGRTAVTEADIDRVAPLVLLHRRQDGRPPKEQPVAPSPSSSKPAEVQAGSADERVFLPEDVPVPTLRARADPGARPADRAAAESVRTTASPPGSAGSETSIQLHASLRKATVGTAQPQLHPEYLVRRPGVTGAPTCFLFVVDVSSSLAARQRIRTVKGVVIGLLEQSARQACQVSVIVFRGARAEILLPPDGDIERARRCLEYVPCGGRTPLAHALQLAAEYPQAHLCTVLLTDGQANVALSRGDPWSEALEQAARIRCPALVVDCSTTGEPRLAELARTMGARLISLEELTTEGVLELARTGAGPNPTSPLFHP
ncbi:MAG: AAA family ATPase [Bryobacterales bacterium]|nr:AAA family ATPase [Bryobacteraceae bacterium]MDW8355198.1 AAA family ATPase [Bryobacterales bacterium]